MKSLRSVLRFMGSYIVATPTNPTRQRDDERASERAQTDFRFPLNEFRGRR